MVICRFIIGVLVGLSCLTVLAREKTGVEDDRWNNRFGCFGALTSEISTTTELSFHRMLTPWIGVGGGVGSWKILMPEGYVSGKGWSMDLTGDNRPFNIFLHPSIVLRTPTVRVGKCNIGLYAEPGFMMNVPYQRVEVELTEGWRVVDYDYVSTTRGQWCATDARLGLYLFFLRGDITVGYMISNQDIYSPFREMVYRGVKFRDYFPARSSIQGIFASLSCYF